MTHERATFGLVIALLIGVLSNTSACAPEPTGWQSIYATTIAPNCTTSACHSPLSKAAGVELHDSEIAFEKLTGRSCDDDLLEAGGYVNPALPSESFLLILMGRQGPTGMPPNRMLSENERDHIEVWIAEGARCN